MRLEPISAAEVLAALERNGTRAAKIAAVADKLNGDTRYFQDDDLTVIVSDGCAGIAERHSTNSKDVETLANWVENRLALHEDNEFSGELREMEVVAGRVLSRMDTDTPDADRGMSIAACRLLR